MKHSIVERRVASHKVSLPVHETQSITQQLKDSGRQHQHLEQQHSLHQNHAYTIHLFFFKQMPALRKHTLSLSSRVTITTSDNIIIHTIQMFHSPL